MSGVGVDIRSNLDAIVKQFHAETAQIEVATYRALNRALDTSATESNREIRKRYNVRARAINNALEKLRANKNRLWATLRIESARIPLIEFDARWRRGQKVGATVRVLIGGPRKTVAGAFIASVKGGKLQVLKRVGSARLPVRALTSVSIPQAFNRVVDAVQRSAIEAFETNFEQQLRFLGGENGG